MLRFRPLNFAYNIYYAALPLDGRVTDNCRPSISPFVCLTVRLSP